MSLISETNGFNCQFFTARVDRNTRVISLTQHHPTKDVRFGSKVSEIGPKWDKSGTFSHLWPI